MLSLWLCGGAAAECTLHQLARRVEIDRYPLSILGCVVVVYFVLVAAIKHFNDDVSSLGNRRSALLIRKTPIVSLWMPNLG